MCEPRRKKDPPSVKLGGVENKPCDFEPAAFEGEAHQSEGSKVLEWNIPSVYEDGCTVRVDGRGMVIISQTILLQLEQQIELSAREIVTLIRLLPDVLRAAQANGKEQSGTPIH